MRAVDTNILVRLIAQDDARQVARAERFIVNGAWVSLLALAEAVWVLSSVYDRGRREIIRAVEIVREHETLTLQDPDVVDGALMAFKAHSTVSFTDCLLLEIARKAGHLPLGTFDHGLGRADGAQKL